VRLLLQQKDEKILVLVLLAQSLNLISLVVTNTSIVRMMEVDESSSKPVDYYDRYSRQYYVIGEHAMNRMGKANVFISGMSGVGVEIGRHFISLSSND